MLPLSLGNSLTCHCLLGMPVGVDQHSCKTAGSLQQVRQSSEVLAEENTNDLLFSPDQLDQASASESTSGNPCIITSPTVSKKNHGSHLVESTSAPSENMPDNSGHNAGTENFGMFGDTPFKRSIESPSAWKSPWFINSFVPGPRIDTEISIEDIGYFMSPGDRSYDAIALMKQLSEHTASAYADALEVLGKDTQESILKERRRSNDPNCEQENRSNLVPNVSTECRTLDISECETPRKRTENGKSSTAISFSSPSSYLLKGCRHSLSSTCEARTNARLRLVKDKSGADMEL
ncbi:unnamed protein product [Dovyalis caffra]|uniref:Uncharacterized protein n=1 Tax=Dovyalis caffra TaxID=77055 RepID=A0AAV1SPI8_9ROSI|nr:unnamed protein product [Dovyalis caffra]